MLQSNPSGTDRRTRILDAAELCFVRSGFHRTTMQDVAAEAGMSAGNLYRYFPSKDAIVAGLSERDRRDVAESFATMPGGDFMAGFRELGRRHFEDEPRDKAVLCLEIWAEATRNAQFAKLTADFASDLLQRLTDLLDGARAAGNIAPAMDTRTIATLIMTMADGLFVRRAVLPGFDAATEIPPIMQVIYALVTGAVAPACQPEEAIS